MGRRITSLSEGDKLLIRWMHAIHRPQRYIARMFGMLAKTMRREERNLGLSRYCPKQDRLSAEQIKVWIEDGMSLTEISRRCCTSRRTVTKFAAKNGLSLPKKGMIPFRRRDPQGYEDMIAMFREEWPSNAAIGRKIGLSAKAVWYHREIWISEQIDAEITKRTKKIGG